MMHRMTHCPATGTITLDGQPTAVICNRTPHDPDEQHNDAVLGDWPDVQHPAQAAQLIADAYNAARSAGLHVYHLDGHINVSRGHAATFEHAEVFEDHEGTWRVEE